jgi:hypothetical protein
MKVNLVKSIKSLKINCALLAILIMVIFVYFKPKSGLEGWTGAITSQRKGNFKNNHIYWNWVYGNNYNYKGFYKIESPGLNGKKGTVSFHMMGYSYRNNNTWRTAYKNYKYYLAPANWASKGQQCKNQHIQTYNMSNSYYYKHYKDSGTFYIQKAPTGKCGTDGVYIYPYNCRNKSTKYYLALAAPTSTNSQVYMRRLSQAKNKTACWTLKGYKGAMKSSVTKKYVAKPKRNYWNIKCTKTYKYTGSQQVFTVPSNVKSLDIELWGAKGGDAQYYSGFWYGTKYQNHVGGKGGKTIGTLKVNPGDKVYIFIGGAGTKGKSYYYGSRYNRGGYKKYWKWGSIVKGGWNGGGSAPARQYATSGSGGGATDIRLNGTTLSSRVMVAGGGGGSYGYGNYTTQSYWKNHGNGGDGGGEAGNDGTATVSSSWWTPGAGGGQSSGGKGGTYGYWWGWSSWWSSWWYNRNYWTNTYGSGKTGTKGAGGAGKYQDAGGGGGGYYGGGGGCWQTAGGGGSGFFDSKKVKYGKTTTGGAAKEKNGKAVIKCITLYPKIDNCPKQAGPTCTTCAKEYRLSKNKKTCELIPIKYCTKTVLNLATLDGKLMKQKWKGYFNDNIDFFNAKPSSTASTIKIVDLKDEGSLYSYKISGYFLAPKTGEFQFKTKSDDASYVFIGKKKVVDNGKSHGARERTGKIKLVLGTLYPITIYFGEKTGGASLLFWWKQPKDPPKKETTDKKKKVTATEKKAEEPKWEDSLETYFGSRKPTVTGRKCNKCMKKYELPKKGQPIKCVPIKIANCAKQVGIVCQGCKTTYDLDKDKKSKTYGGCKKIPRIKDCTKQVGYECKDCGKGFEPDKKTKKCKKIPRVKNCTTQVGHVCNECAKNFESSKDKLRCIKIPRVENCKEQTGNKCKVCSIGYELSKDRLMCFKMKAAVKGKEITAAAKKKAAENKGPKSKADTKTKKGLYDTAGNTCPWDTCCKKKPPSLAKTPFMRPHGHELNPKINSGLNDINQLLEQWYTKIKPKPPRKKIEPDWKSLSAEKKKIDALLAGIKDKEIRDKLKKKPPKKAFPVDIDVTLNDDIDVPKDIRNRIVTRNAYSGDKSNKGISGKIAKAGAAIQKLRKGITKNWGKTWQGSKKREAMVSGGPGKGLPLQNAQSWGFGPLSKPLEGFVSGGGGQGLVLNQQNQGRTPAWGYGPLSINKKSQIRRL